MKRIYAIPGIGTTKELFQKIDIPGYELCVLSWPPALPHYTLNDYAAEFLKQIDTTGPVNLIGVSFGGMLCAEIGSMIKTGKVILISSCSSRRQFPAVLKLLRFFPVHRLVSDRFIRLVARTKRRYLGFERSFEPVFLEMINSMPPGYFYNCVNYIIRWDRQKADPAIIQIHGTCDRLLSYRHIKPRYRINKGSHTMVLNNAGEINRILNTEFNGN